MNEISTLKAEQINIPDINVRANRKLPFDDYINDRELHSPPNIPIPPTQSQQYSFHEAVSRGIGHYAICEFLIGSKVINTREGILKEVGQNYFTLYNEETDTSISCDLHSLRFITFFRAGIRPGM